MSLLMQQISIAQKFEMFSTKGTMMAAALKSAVYVADVVVKPYVIEWSKKSSTKKTKVSESLFTTKKQSIAPLKILWLLEWQFYKHIVKYCIMSPTSCSVTLFTGQVWYSKRRLTNWPLSGYSCQFHLST